MQELLNQTPTAKMDKRVIIFRNYKPINRQVEGINLGAAYDDGPCK
jgi:hypothetical protein